jgi:hypothetical protein
MPRKSKRSNKKSNKLKKTRKQKVYVMRGCSKNPKSCNHNHKKGFSTLGNNDCPNCGPKCPHHLNSKFNRKLNGGGGCGSCGCPISPLTFKQMNMFGGQNEVEGDEGLKGGNFFKPSGPIPGPIVGSAWGASFKELPGGNDVGGDRNFLKPYNTNNNIIGKDPQLQMSLNGAGYNTMNSKVGGRIKGKRGNKNKSIKGGGLIPQDLVNLGSNFSFNLKSAYNSLNGYKAPIDPLPYKDQLTQNNKF